jgi:threonine synthase
MDVGTPSNMERLFARDATPAAFLADDLQVHVVSDGTIQQTIRDDFAQRGRIWCPHSAVGAAAHEWMRSHAVTPWRHDDHAVLVATAHPAKFAEVVEPLIGEPVAVPPALAALFARPSSAIALGADVAALVHILSN